MNLDLKTERLLLKPLVQGDLDWCIEMFTDPDVVRYIFDDTPTTEEIIAEMPKSVKRAGGGTIGVWSVFEINLGKYLGTAALLPLPIIEDDTNWDLLTGQDELPEGDIEIGYIFNQFAWGKGYATEAATRILRFAFEQSPLAEVVAVIDAENIASRNVLEKNWFY